MLAPLALAILTAQSPGQIIAAKDGDVVQVDRGARVKIVTHSEGVVRAIYNAQQRWLVLLVDYTGPNGAPPDGFVDYAFGFSDVDGQWPLGARWQGAGQIDDIALAGQAGRVAINLRTPSGLYQIANGPLNSGAVDLISDPSAVARLTYQTASVTGMGGGTTFDVAEIREVNRATMRANGTIGTPAGGMMRSPATVIAAPVEVKPETPAMSTSGAQPVRVGGSIPTPQKIVDAQPVYPPMAQSARVQGVVILQITIGVDGSVTDAKVLRSIPMLDQAALDCVKQWMFKPTQLNGTPVPVIMTATVNFTLQ